MLAPLLIAALSTAQAQDTLEYWSWNDWDDDTSYAGTDDWDAGYRGDDWWGYRGDEGLNWVFSSSDDDGGDFGDGGPHDNWLVQTGVDVDDGVVTTIIYTEDDDTIGMVARHQNADEYYLFIMTGDERGSDGPLDDRFDEALLLRIDNGDVEVLASERGAYERYTVMRMAIAFNDGEITAAYWNDYTDEDPDLVVTATESEPLPPGAFGFYAYNAGGFDDGIAAFGVTDVYRFDDDGDGVADDEDNCESTANPDQEDGDDNGIGTACDPDEATDGGDDGGGEDGGGDDGDGGSDTASPVDINYEEGGKVSGCGGCDGTGGAVGGLLVAVLAGVARRRE